LRLKEIGVRFIGCWLGALLLVGNAQASVIGSIWENNPTAAGNAIPGNVPNSTPNVTFSTVSPISFSSGGLYTIGEFLASGSGSTILTGSGELGNTLDNTIFNFTGTVTVTNGETFTAGHDDGLTLIVDGITVISDPGPTAFAITSETYTGPTGTFPFQLVYGECCGAPADLSISLPLTTPTPPPSGVPEPSSFLLLLGGFLGLAGLSQFARSKATKRV
jgi:hypothetical protein